MCGRECEVREGGEGSPFNQFRLIKYVIMLVCLPTPRQEVLYKLRMLARGEGRPLRLNSKT